MKTSETITKIAPAFLSAQKSIGAAVKGENNPFFKSKYADLGDVMQACKQALNDNGISVLQPVGMDGERTFVETVLLHESGEYISEKMLIEMIPQSEKSVKEGREYNKPQAQGSAISYARRYALQSMVFIPAEDDDANKATSRQEPQRTPQPSKLANNPTPTKNAAPDAPGDVPPQSALKKQFEALHLLAQDNTPVQWPQFVAKALELKVKDVTRLLQSGDLNYGECKKVSLLLQQYRDNVTQSTTNVA